jgi:hypothetical protein
LVEDGYRQVNDLPGLWLSAKAILTLRDIAVARDDGLGRRPEAQLTPAAVRAGAAARRTASDDQEMSALFNFCS